MSNNNNTPSSTPNNNGRYNQFSDLIAFYDRKRRECPKGVRLKLHQNRLLFLQFTDPTTGKKTSKTIGVAFTEKGIIEAIDKAYKVSEALKTYATSSDFWDWFNESILKKNIIENDKKTYRDIFEEIKTNYFNGKNRNTGRKRERDINKQGGISDWNSFNAQYGNFFKLFPDWDKYPSWDEMRSIWFTKEQGSKTFLTFKTVLIAIAELTPNNTKLLKQIKSVNATQTKFKNKQSINLDEFINWYKEQINSLDNIDREDFRNSKQSWLWVASMCVLYGLRPSEVTAIKNLDEPYKQDNVTIYSLTDNVNNPECTIVIGEFTYFGTSTKTGFRLVNPVPLKHLWEDLKIREPLPPIYNPKKDSKPDSIASGFDNKFYKHLINYKCPITQKYAFRHLYNQLLEMCGVNTSIRSRLMGHSETTNQGTYKKRRNLKTELDIINSVNKKDNQCLDIDTAKQRLLDNGFNVNDVDRILRIIYQN